MVSPRDYLDVLPFAAMLVVTAGLAAVLPNYLPAASIDFLYVLMAPPLLLLAVLPLARLALEVGHSARLKGHLDHLLQQKRAGLLDLSRPRFEGHERDEQTSIRTSTPGATHEPAEPETLDRLVAWKRQRPCPDPDRRTEYANE